MERPHFLEWFKKLFLPAVSSILEKGPVILFMDGHASHIKLKVDHTCQGAWSDSILSAIAHHACTPAPRRWCVWATEELLEEDPEGLQNGDVTGDGGQNSPGLLSKLWEASFWDHHLKAGFRKAGLCPVSKEAIPKSSYATSLPLTPPSQEPRSLKLTPPSQEPRSFELTQPTRCIEIHTDVVYLDVVGCK